MGCIHHLPPMENFEDVMIVPFTDLTTGKNQISGPIWPDWDSQVRARHCRHGIPFDSIPTPVDQVYEVVTEPLSWIGPAHTHFGHYVSEYATRILQSIRDKPKNKLFFDCGSSYMMKHKKYANTPQHFQAVNAWYGVNPEQVEFCLQPILAKNLSVAGQAEQITKLRQKNLPMAPAVDYLDMLDENRDRNNLQVIKNKIVYVSRGRMPVHVGQHGGAKYLDIALNKLGIIIFHPEQHTLINQLSMYAGAEQLILAEGSSLHGLQLLGRSYKSIVVLNRRIGTSMIKNYLKPRCEELHYLDAVKSNYCFIDPNGVKREAFSFSMFDVPLLFQTFSSVGIDLERVWDSSSYDEALKNDMLTWVMGRIRILSQRGLRRHQNELVNFLREDGYDEFADFTDKQVKSLLL